MSKKEKEIVLMKKNSIEIFKKLGQKCTECGEFFIGAAIQCSTENGNYGVYFDDFGDYSLSCGKCPTCAERCYDKLVDYINDHGHAPCCEDNKINSDENIISFINNLKEFGYIECYSYTNDYQDHQLQYKVGGLINGGELIDITEVLLKKIDILSKDDLKDII